MKTAEIKKNVIQPNRVLQTIYDRRAVRKYNGITVDRIIIDQLIDAARMAPSAMNRQPWKFYVVTDKEFLQAASKEIAKVALKQIAKISLKDIGKSIWHYLHAPHEFSFHRESDFIFHEAPLVIFITAPIDNEWAILDIGMCSQNMMLAAKSLGLDSCPVGLAKFIEETESVKKLGLGKNEKIQLAVIFGYSDEHPEVKERKKDNVIYVK